jgi:Leucine rich repeat variant
VAFRTIVSVRDIVPKDKPKKRPVKPPSGSLISDNTSLEDKLLEAKNPSISGSRLGKLANDASKEVRLAVARNPSTSSAILVSLASDTDLEIVKTVVRHEHLPSETLSVLAVHPDPTVRIETARWFKTPNTILASMSNDTNGLVRQAIAYNPATDRGTLNRLAEDTNRDVRIMVASNPQTPTATLKQLSNDTDVGVKRAAMESLDGSLQDVLTRSVIALPLLKQIEQQDSPLPTVSEATSRIERDGTQPAKHAVVIDLNLDFRNGIEGARSQLKTLLGQLNAGPITEKIETIGQFVFIELTQAQLVELVQLDHQPKKAWIDRTIYRIWPDFEVRAM